MRFRILVLALGTFATGTDTFVIAGILPNIASSLHVTLALAGLAVTIFSLVYAFAAPILAAFTGAWERRRLLVLSLSILVVTNLLGAVAPNLPFLLIVRVLAALGASLYTPTALAAATALTPPERRGQALGLVTTGLTASTVLGVPLGLLIATWLNWQATLVFVAILSIVAIIGVLAFFPQVAAPPVVTLGSRLAFLKKPGLAVALVQTLLIMAGYQILGTYLRPILQQLGHFSDITTSGLFFLFGLAGLAGGLVGGNAIDRWGGLRVAVVGMSFVAIVQLILPWGAQTLVGAGLLLLIWGALGWAVTPAQQHRLVSFAPASAGIVLSLNSSAIYFGASLGSLLGGIFIQTTTIQLMCWLAGVWSVLTVLFILLSARQGRAKRSTVEREEPITSAAV